MAAAVDLDAPAVRATLVAAIADRFHMGAGVCRDRAQVLARAAVNDTVERLEQQDAGS